MITGSFGNDIHRAMVTIRVCPQACGQGGSGIRIDACRNEPEVALFKGTGQAVETVLSEGADQAVETGLCKHHPDNIKCDSDLSHMPPAASNTSMGASHLLTCATVDRIRTVLTAAAGP